MALFIMMLEFSEAKFDRRLEVLFKKMTSKLEMGPDPPPAYF